MKNWLEWHADYDDPGSSLNMRLRRVQTHLDRAISAAPPGPVRVLSLCAGQGHDVIGVLPEHPRRDDVTAVLVEFDPRNVALGRDAARAAGLDQVRFQEADAGLVAGFADALPADVLLLCGIFGNISEDDIRRTVAAAPAMCRGTGSVVLWTRHRREPDLTPRIRDWFERAGFEEIAFDPIEGEGKLMSVGAARLERPASASAASIAAGEPLFTFRTP